VLPPRDDCYCNSYSYGTRGPKLIPQSSCQKCISCFEDAGKSYKVTIMQCEPRYAYDIVPQVYYFKGDMDYFSCDPDNLGKKKFLLNAFLSSIQMIRSSDVSLISGTLPSWYPTNFTHLRTLTFNAARMKLQAITMTLALVMET